MKAIKLAAIAAAVALPMQFAHAAEPAVNAQLVIPDVDGFGGGMGIALGYEMPMPNVNPNFSFEGELTKSLSSPETNGFEFSYFSLSGYGKYTHQIDSKMDLYGRAGLTYTRAEVEYSNWCVVNFTVTTCRASDTDTETSLSLGFGMNYEINPQMDFTAGYTILHKDINHLSAGIKYKL